MNYCLIAGDLVDTEREKQLVYNWRKNENWASSTDWPAPITLYRLLSGLHTANLSWQTRVCKPKLVCVPERHKNSRQTRFYLKPTICKRVYRLFLCRSLHIIVTIIIIFYHYHYYYRYRYRYRFCYCYCYNGEEKHVAWTLERNG